jgi:hypothetical protein
MCEVILVCAHDLQFHDGHRTHFRSAGYKLKSLAQSPWF